MGSNREHPNGSLKALEPDFALRLDARLAELMPQLSPDERDRRMNATVDFLRCCFAFPNTEFAPSPAVDEVWHEMIVMTADYRSLCNRIGNGFVDHRPFANSELPGPNVSNTVDAMVSLGIDVAPQLDLWETSAAARCCGSHVTYL